MKKRLLRRALVLAACVCFLVLGDGSLVKAQNMKIWTSISAEEMGGILKEMGIKFEEEVDPDGDSYFSFRLGGRVGGFITTLIFFQEPEKGRYPRVQLRTGWKLGNPPKLEQINDWNNKKCFANAYRRPDGGFVLRYDFRLTGGVTTRAIKTFIENYESLLIEFVIHMRP